LDENLFSSEFTDQQYALNAARLAAYRVVSGEFRDEVLD
jgi:hypothetical protein